MKSAIVFFFAITATFFAHSQMLDFSIPVEENTEIVTQNTTTTATTPRYQLPTPNFENSPQHAMFQNHVDVPAGTQITFKTNEKISAARLSDGQMIRLKVASDVIIDRKIVIRTNTLATGIVRVEQPTSAYSEGQLTIEVMNTTDIQGKTVILNSDPNYITANQPGMPVDLPLGQLVTASTQNNIEVSLK